MLHHLKSDIHSIHSYPVKINTLLLDSDKSTLLVPPKQHHPSDFMLNKIRICLIQFVLLGWLLVVVVELSRVVMSVTNMG